MRFRSLLFVPAKEKTLSKIGQANADAYIIDLEDSIEEPNKQAALEQAQNWLRQACLQDHVIFVRLNKGRYKEEVRQLGSFGNIGFMLPKFEDCREYREAEDIWKEHRVIALIETPLGIVNIDRIAGCDWVDMLAFGAEDYTAYVNMANKSEYLRYQKSVLVTFAKAYGKQVFDTPSFELADTVKLREETEETVSLGFDGKLAIHPRQTAVINEAFSAADIPYMESIVKAYEEQGEAVLVYDGKPYEKMHIARFKRIIKENGGI